MGAHKGFASLVKRQNPAIQITHCCIHREALMIKLLTQELSETMSDCIEIVNLIKAKALNSRIFSILCNGMESEHQSLLFYTSVRWLSEGKVLARLFELQSEVKQFLLKQNKHELYKHLEDDHWIAKFAYMADVFEHMNELNIKVQGISENILTCSDKSHGFKQKLLWQNALRLGFLEMFPRSYKNQKNVEKGFVLNLAKEHLTLIQQKYYKYFFANNSEQYDCIRNPFSANAKMSTKELPLRIRENFFEVRNDRTRKLKFSEVQLDMFWISIQEEYKRISKAAIEILLQFCTIYICEQSFLFFLLIKNDKRSCIKNVDDELRVALLSIQPNIERLCY